MFGISLKNDAFIHQVERNMCMDQGGMKNDDEREREIRREIEKERKREKKMKRKGRWESVTSSIICLCVFRG